MSPVNPNTAPQPITAVLMPHMVQALAMALLTQWRELEHVQREQPLQKIDFITLIQCFSKLGLSRVADVLLKNDTEYLKTHLFNTEPHVIAQYMILTNGQYPVNHGDLKRIVK
ncbi:hypothetical protein COPG_00132 [Colwellia phage 9A]|uniref:Uncharacterized protein n=1 Tax=Colwellia phage 9A TaxID=765765 RepID=I3UML3_9CAUD|nr:hypothetical protein COPG_00132 [Colwellia phage 9A]AFK66728.1 hypothetical protein COPG_00132 [Colwellia phage 9A]